MLVQVSLVIDGGLGSNIDHLTFTVRMIYKTDTLHGEVLAGLWRQIWILAQENVGEGIEECLVIRSGWRICFLQGVTKRWDMFQINKLFDYGC